MAMGSSPIEPRNPHTSSEEDRGFVNFKEVIAGIGMILPALRQETSQMPFVQKLPVWLSLVMLLGVAAQALFAFPIAIWLFGWGYSVA